MRTGSSGSESGGGAQSDEGSSELLPASSLPGPPRGGNRHTASLVLVTPLGPQDPRTSALHPYGDTTLSGHHFPVIPPSGSCLWIPLLLGDCFPGMGKT